MPNTEKNFNLLSITEQVEIAMKFVIDKALEKGVITQRGLELYDSRKLKNKDKDKDWIEVNRFMKSKQFNKDYIAYYNERINKDSGINNAVIIVATGGDKKTYKFDSIQDKNQVERIAKRLIKETPKCKGAYISIFQDSKLRFYISLDIEYGKIDRKEEYYK